MNHELDKFYELVEDIEIWGVTAMVLAEFLALVESNDRVME